MKRLPFGLVFIVAALVSGTSAYACSWSEGYFYQVSALRGNVVGAKMGPLQYVRFLRQSFSRTNVRLSLYHYRSKTKQDEMVLVATTKTDNEGGFDFGNISPGHYTLTAEDTAWGSSERFDVELLKQSAPMAAVTIDVSPPFPDCKGGHEFIVNPSGLPLLARQLVLLGIAGSLGLVIWYLWSIRPSKKPTLAR